MSEKWTRGPLQADGVFMEYERRVRVAVPDRNGTPGETVAVCFVSDLVSDDEYSEPAPDERCIGLVEAEANAQLFSTAAELAEALECWPLQELLGMVEDSGDAEMWLRAKWFMEVRNEVMRKARGETE